ncbi:MAG TPA: BrnT family toxin [Rhodopila sp.]|nr:BrnT family toxin [Rhodopila sp.]
MEFGWDPAKDARTFRERGFGFAYVIRIFAGPVVEIVDRRRDYGEERITAIGEVDGRAYVVVYTDRRVDGLSVRWIISAWKASGKDQRRWQNRA